MEGLVTDGGWATDGTRVYYLVRKASRTTVYQVPVDGRRAGSGADRAARPVQPVHLGYLPGSRRLLMTGSEMIERADTQKGGALWTAPVPAGARRGSGTSRRSAARPRPTATMLALRQRGNRLVVVARRRHRRPRMAAAPVAAVAASHGRRTADACASGPLGPDQRRSWIWEVSVDGGEAPRALWPGDGGRWTPDGRFYVFDAETTRPKGVSDVYAGREPGSPGSRRSQPRPPHRSALSSFTRRRTEPRREAWLFALGDAPTAASCCATTRGRAASGSTSTAPPSTSWTPLADGQWLTWVSYPRRRSLERSLRRERPAEADRARLVSPSAALVARRRAASCSRAGAGGEAALDLRVSRPKAVRRSCSRAARPRSSGTPAGFPTAVRSSISHLETEPGYHRARLASRRLDGCRAASDSSTRSARPGAMSSRRAAEAARLPYWAPRGRAATTRRSHPVGVSQLVGRRPGIHRPQRSRSAHRALVSSIGPSRARRGRRHPLVPWAVVPWIGLAATARRSSCATQHDATSTPSTGRRRRLCQVLACQCRQRLQ